MAIKPVIFGCSGPTLTREEKEFFKKHQPYGYIIFARNIENPEQVKKLIADLKKISGEKFVPILIDQEGGRVCRLKPPFWTQTPACGVFEARSNPEQAAYDSAFNIAHELTELGINVNCAPMLDVRDEKSHNIIGDRAFSGNAKTVAKLGKAFMDGLLDGGVLPVIKHIPGHGRGTVDSHEDLPVVTASLEELKEVDFYPFKKLKSAPYAMTAHIIYKSIDAKNPATTSKKVIDIIRKDIGFKNQIMTDDLSMKALKGSFKERTQQSLEAGCDLILHCNGEMAEMHEIAEALV